MLRHLSIKNYTLIDSLEIDFPAGFSTITGETGAGKSIILGALGLLDGARADASLIRQKDAKAVVEAFFSSADPEIANLLRSNDIDADTDEIILRREISPAGRSRAFVNDTPVNLATLAQISSRLIDIHSQHNNILLTDSLRQRDILDAFGGLAPLVDDCRARFLEFAALRSQINRRKKQIEEARKNRESIEFRLSRLRELNLRKGELKELEERLDILSDAEQIRESLYSAYYALDEGDSNALSLISTALNALDGLNIPAYGTNDQSSESLHERLLSATIELKDIAETIRDIYSDIEVNPRALASVDERIRKIYETRKFLRVAEADDLVSLREKLENELAAIDGIDPDFEETEARAREKLALLREAAARLSEARRDAAVRFTAKITESARTLGLQNLTFSIGFEKGKIGPEGLDEVSFLCAFNKNSDLLPLAKVASGGEISRLMLCIKALIASRMNLPTVIFDEIDTGVSGEIADRMARMMLSLGKSMQVITVTHLPQVAAKGEHQFLVYKSDDDTSTRTSMRLLTSAEREKAIAAMLSGSSVGDAALLNARSLLDD